MTREILPFIFKIVDSRRSGPKPQVNIGSFLFRVPIEIHAHHYNWTAQAYCCLDHWMTGCGFIPLRWEEWEFFSKWYPWNTITDQFDQWLTIVDFFYHSLAFKFRSPKPSFKHSIHSVISWLHKLVDYTEAHQGPKKDKYLTLYVQSLLLWFNYCLHKTSIEFQIYNYSRIHYWNL